MLALWSIWCAVAGATVYSSEIATGVVWNLDYTADHEVHSVEIDLAVPELYLRVMRETEGPSTISEFAGLTDSVVTINGDWVDTDYNRPLGLAVGNGWQWTGTHDWDGSIDPPGDWSFLACRASKDCFFDPESSYQDWDWVWQNVVGGNGARLIVDGVLRTPAWDSDERPRSGVCLDSTGTKLIFVVAEGDGAGASGVGAWLEGTSYTFDGYTPWEFASYMYDLGCWNAMGLDGGGSSDLVVVGSRVTDRSPEEPDERTLYSHLSVVESTTTDSECSSTMNGRYCDSGVLNICQGGAREVLDCGYYGWDCEADDDTAYCVDPTCTNGGMNDLCLDDEVMIRCAHGWATEFDCSTYGYGCESTPGSARCTHPDCLFGGEASWCDGNTLKSCAIEDADGLELGSPQDDVDCAATGQICVDATCIDALPGDSASTGEDSDADDTGESKRPGCAAATLPGSWTLAVWGLAALYRRRRAHPKS